MDSLTLRNWLSTNSAGDTSFGHLKYEPSHKPTEYLWLELLAMLGQPEGSRRVVVVQPDTTCGQFNLQCLSQDTHLIKRNHLWTYVEWLEVVRGCWSRSEPLSEVDQTIFLFEVHPVMSVSCAMALLATIQTAIETAPGNVTRLLTVSSTDVDRAFVRLVEHYGYGSPQLFTHVNRVSLDTEPEEVRTIYYASKAELNRRAIERIGSLQGKQIVIDTKPCYLATVLDLDDSWKHVSMASSNFRLIVDALSGDLDNVVLHVSPGVYSPLPLREYDHVRVIAESDPMTYETDTTTNQSTREDVNLEWWEDGPVLRRQNVWSRCLGAFIAEVTSLGSKVDAAAVVQCFVPEGINNLGQDGHLAMNLEGQELTAFFTVLDLVRDDYRLAYLIAQQSETEDDMVLQPADTLEAVIRACTGYSASLGDKGSMWLALGLWNRVGKDSMNFSQVPDSDSVPISGTSVLANWARCVQVHELWKDISSVLAANGVDTVRRELTDETLSLSDEDCETIDTHLLKAYLSQLVVHNPVRHDLEFLDVSTRRPMIGFLSEAGATLDFERMLQTYGPAFGIYHHLVRGNGKVMFKDFTSVSSGIVDGWMEENWDRSREYDAVIESMDEDETLPRPNYDEYN
ncbi:hypothetical protein FPCIR_14104 [Fusarium pseudocircinatum]|uniref:Uncharacterized protein n=1 Tax=Fusarium pseudocircinatum TaxID=56676 RepID=A0A8H5NPC9_9HYPO|nr:hypothetical protein FPCIR_14104 [Fusarium pseudocircinatum]